MTLLKAQVVLRTADNLPENFVTNTLYLDTLDEAVQVSEDWAVAIQTFYNAVRTYMSDLLSQNGHEIKFYFVDQPTPNFPFNTVSWNFSSALVGNPLPSECAIVCSYQAVKVNGENQGRRRGRIYLGPLSDDVNLDGRVQPGIQAAIATAFKTYILDAYGVGLGTRPVVYSATAGTNADVNDGWVDNAFDTQRRRGIASSNRQVWDLS